MRLVLELLAKQLRELRLTLLSCMVGLSLFLTLASYLFKTFGDGLMRDFSRFSPELLSGLLGGLAVGFDPLTTWLATLLVHPLLVTFLTAATVAITSRGLAGEVDRGTMDLLLATPVSRAQIVVANLIAVQLALALLVLAAWFSLRLGLLLAGIEPSELQPLRWAAFNLWSLFAAVGGVGLLASAFFSEQGKAIAVTVSFVVISFFVNLIASLWSLVSWTDFVSIFHYYQPHPLLRSGEVPVMHLSVLLGLAIFSAAGAVLVFGRRDIHAP